MRGRRAAGGCGGCRAGRRRRGRRRRGWRGRGGRRRGVTAPTASSTSLRVRRPPGPVPVIVDGSRPRSATRRRTIGDVSCGASPARRVSTGSGPGPGSGSGTGLGGGGSTGGGSAGGGSAGGTSATAGAGPARGPGAGAGSGGGAGAGGPGAGRWLGAARRRGRCGRRSGRRRGLSGRGGAAAAGGVADHREAGAHVDGLALRHEDLGDRRRPTGAGTSESTLSVDTSNSGSSASTCSPTCFSQRVIVPSVTVSPSWGIVTSTAYSSSLPRASDGQPISAAGGRSSASAASPNTSLSVGCGWTSAAMSAAFASQLT